MHASAWGLRVSTFFADMSCSLQNKDRKPFMRFLRDIVQSFGDQFGVENGDDENVDGEVEDID